MIWGVNIHPSYKHVTPSETLYLTKSLGLTSVRLDVYEANAQTKSFLSSLLTVANPIGLDVMPVLVEPNASALGSEQSCFNWGYDTARPLALAFPQLAWEAGNEFDLRCGIPGNTGDLQSHYDDSKYRLCRGAIRGMYQGFKSASTMPVGVNTSGNNFGFLDRLAADGVQWDVTTWHIYINSSTSAADLTNGASRYFSRLAGYGKPISITEFNQQDGHLQTNKPTTLINMMNAIEANAASRNINSAYIYELLDEPHLEGSEATYGLADTHGKPNALGAAVKARLVA